MKTIRAFIFLSVLSLSFSSRADSRFHCAELFDQIRIGPLAYLKPDRFDSPVEFKIEVDGISHYIVAKMNGRLVGSMDYRIFSNGKMEMTYIFSSVRQAGVSKALFARALLEHPEVVEIKSYLADVNAEIYYEGIESGLSSIDALKNTPAYKIRASIGFTRIIHFERMPHSSSWLLIVGRP